MSCALTIALLVSCGDTTPEDAASVVSAAAPGTVVSGTAQEANSEEDQVSDSTHTSAIVIDLPTQAVETLTEDPTRSVFAANPGYLRGRATSTAAANLAAAIESAAGTEERLLLPLFPDTEITLKDIELITSSPSEWPGTPNALWQATAVTSSGSEGSATVVRRLESVRLEIRFDLGSFYVLDTLADSGGVLQIGELDPSVLPDGQG